MVIGLLIFYGMKVTVFLKRFLISLRLRIINIDRALCGIAVYATALLILTRHPFFALLPCAVAFLFFLALAFYEITPSTYVVEGNPIEDEANDILQRTPILEALEKHVAAGTPIVALVGDFGDGKTSVLKMLLKRLQNNRNVITVPFSSWLPGSEKALATTLLGNVSKALAERYATRSIRNGFNKYARVLTGAIPSMPSFLRDLL